MSKRLKICNKILFSALVKLGQGVCLQMGKVLRAACVASLCLLCPLLLFYFVAGKLIFFSHSPSLSVCFCPSGAKGALPLWFNVLSSADLGTVDYRS